MPTTSPAQERFMQAVAHNPAFASKVGVPQSVGKEFVDSDPLDGLLQQLGFLQEWCDALNRRLDAYLSMRADADFEESEHPRDQDGKFAKTAEGAKAGMEFHAGEAAKYKAQGKGEFVRPHNRAAGHYKTAMEHYLAGRQAEGEESHKSGQKHGLEGIRRVKKHEGGGVEPVEKKEEKKEAEPTPATEAKPAGTKLTKSEFNKQINQSIDRAHARLADAHEYKQVVGFRTDYSVSDIKAGFDRGAGYNSKSWDHAEPEMQRIVTNMRPVACVNDKGGDAHFKNGTEIINMPKKYDSNAPLRDAIWRHEFGHAIDYEGGRSRPKSFAAVNEMYEDEAAIVENLAEVKKELEDRYKTASGVMLFGEAIKLHKDGDMPPGAIDKEETRFLLADFVGALTTNQVGYGHSKEYYNNYGHHYRTTEMFANYVSLSNHMDGKYLKKIMHTWAPKTCARFDEMLAESGK